MSNPIPNISDADYLAVQEANRQATPSVHSNNSRLFLGSHSLIETLLTPDHASAQHSVHSNPPPEQENAPRMPDGAKARWHYMMRRVSTIPGLQRTEEPEEQAPPSPSLPALPMEITNPDTYGTSLYQVNDDNLPSYEDCAKAQDSGTEKSETQPSYFTNPFESDNDLYSSEDMPVSIHPTISVKARPRDSSVFVNEEYNTVDVKVSDAPNSDGAYPPIEPLRKANSEIQGMWQKSLGK